MPIQPSPLALRFAQFSGIARKPKVSSPLVAKAGTPALSKRPARVQAPAPQPASRFAHLSNVDTAGLAAALQRSTRASVPQQQPQQDLGTQMLASMAEAMRPTGRAAASTSKEMAAQILATSRRLQPSRF